MGESDSGYLVESGWLAERLDDPGVRILDCTVLMRKDDDGTWRSESGRVGYDKGHIPGAQFVDLLHDLQDRESPQRYMLPPPADFGAAMSELGIDGETTVVVYAAAVPWWATRMWWMLRAYGHDRVAVLNGGFGKWWAEGRPLSTEVPRVERRRFEPHLRAELVAGKAQVRAALSDDGTTLVNALSPQLFRGESDLGYARVGRIPGSVNLSALALVDRESGTYLPPERLRAAVTDSLGEAAGEVICYCGGGIAATMDAFVLALLGHDRVAVYDGSLEEWAADPALPMEVG